MKSEQKILHNAMCAELVLSECYNRAVGECGDDSVRDVFLALLAESHEVQRSYYQEMERRNWIPENGST